MEITLVTGNKNKLIEFQKILSDIKFRNEKIDLEEIQSLDLQEICEYKVKKAYEILQRPVIVDDTGFFIDELKGLPGPFIKFFNKLLGGESSIKILGDSANRVATAKTCISYYDGQSLFSVFGEVRGTITYDGREGDGFGFDCCFVPDGYDRTFNEMGIDEKNKISHRKRAIENFRKTFSELILHLT